MALITVVLPAGTGFWLIPDGVTKVVSVKVRAPGGGARGGALLGAGGGGAGSGGVSTRTQPLDVLPGNQIDLTLPSGGSGSPYNSNTTEDGATASASYLGTTLARANGGGRSTNFSGGAGADTTGAVGDVLVPGVAGDSTSNSVASNGGKGADGPNGGGTGGAGSTSAANGGDGGAPGAGGGGGRGNNSPSAGGPGGGAQAEITYVAPEAWGVPL